MGKCPPGVGLTIRALGEVMKPDSPAQGTEDL